MPRPTEPMYHDLVEYLTTHPDTPTGSTDYFNWAGRDKSIDWGGADDESATAIANRYLAQLALASSLPVRPDAPSAHRKSGWLTKMAQVGVLYRTGGSRSATYVLDTFAEWRPARCGRAQLVGNRWEHTPNAKVADVLAVTADPVPPSPPKPPAAPPPAPTLAPPLDLSRLSYDPPPFRAPRLFVLRVRFTDPRVDGGCGFESVFAVAAADVDEARNRIVDPERRTNVAVAAVLADGPPGEARELQP